LHHDQHCFLCRTLAALLEGSTIAIVPLEVPSEDILLTTPMGTTLSGPEAWEALLDLHPALKAWSWLAARLGLEKRQAARAVQGTVKGAAQSIHALCPKCRPIMPTRSQE
jgi:hypothetical protein